ncbi:MAG: BamA/TamA family outer membrane protein [SAR324 cluster bacterium]|nr:BamA/TamA family outer membrane protein [SAR324 cluster bacterium]
MLSYLRHIYTQKSFFQEFSLFFKGGQGDFEKTFLDSYTIRIFLISAFWIGVPFICWASLPHYQLQVAYDAGNRILHGTMEVSFSKQDYPAEELFFALPMNRFVEPDPRGILKHLDTPMFIVSGLRKGNSDPAFPEGFSPGYTTILSVTNTAGNSFPHTIEDNPDLAVGYSTKQGLLKIQTTDLGTTDKIQIEFETKLPIRFHEGVVETELLTAEWHPRLLRFKNRNWPTSQLEPSPGNYQVSFRSSQSGSLITTTWASKITKNQTVVLPVSKRPLKYFPLVFSPRYHFLAPPFPAGIKSSKNYPQKTPFTKGGRGNLETQTSSGRVDINVMTLTNNPYRAKMLKQWTGVFIQFMKTQYGLSPPWQQIDIVEIHGNQEKIQVLNNLILVTTPHYKRSEIMDRRILTFLIRGLGEMWFGETVWNNNDTQLWLRLGLPAYFSLKFFESEYGRDAGIFDFVDWLNPHYKEHFFEEMVRTIPTEQQQPIISSIQQTEQTRLLLRVITYKTALVLSMLEYVLGKNSFKKGLQHFYNQHQHQLATIEDLQHSMERNGKESLTWFFHQWFHTTNTLDYALAEHSYQSLANGRYQTSILVKRVGTATMPVVIEMKTQVGVMLQQQISGDKQEESLTFISDSPPADVSLDPEEQLLETSRANNHSFYFFRVRFIFDWKKQREIMITLTPRAGSNAIDGNQIGLEAKTEIDQYMFRVTPGYGFKSKENLYFLEFRRYSFALNNLTLALRASKIGGAQTRGLRLEYQGLAAEVAYEEVFETDRSEESISSVVESGNTSHLKLSHIGRAGFKRLYFPSWQIEMEQSLVDLGADLQYTILDGALAHAFRVGFRKYLRWTWRAATTDGMTPQQKKHQLGAPSALRGFPLQTRLSGDHLLLTRLEFEFPLVTSPLWGNVSSLGFDGILFYDQGKIWPIGGTYDDALLRKDAGFGIQWRVDALALFQVPLRFAIAYPLDDPEYEEHQFILEGVHFF